MDHRELEEGIASYVLGSLEDAERGPLERALVEHLPGCTSCRELLSDLREVVGDLALDAASQRVPDEVEQRIVDRVRGLGSPAAAVAVASIRKGWRAGLVAAAAAAVALGAWNLQLASRVSDAREEASSVARALSVLGSPDAASVRLDGSQGGSFVFLHRPGEAVLLGRDVEAPEAGRVLQLWLIGPGGPTSMGAFTPRNGIVVLDLATGAAGFETVAITIEPAPGARGPTTDPVYSGSLTA